MEVDHGILAGRGSPWRSLPDETQSAMAHQYAARDLPQPDFRMLFESAPVACLVLTNRLVITAVTDAYLKATKTFREQILGRHLFDVFPDNPDDPAATGVANLRASLDRVLSQKTADTMAVQKYDIRRPASEGGGFEERYWSPRNSPVLVDGQVAYILHAVEDVTEFVRLKQRESEQQQLTEELKTHAGRMECEVFQRAQEIQEANGQLRELQASLARRVETRTADLTRTNDELQRALEQLRHSEEQLRQAQKLEAVGRLAGGIAHDFNNLLSVILSYTELLLSEPGLEQRNQSELEEIKRAGERAADLTRQMLAFSRQQVLEPKILDLNDVLANLSRMLVRVLGEDIELKILPGGPLGVVKADPGQIEQVVMNLVVNARDAMPRGGKLTIATSNVDLDEEYARGHLGVIPGPYVLLSVSDTGVGMNKATQTRIFEPFFTTKERGKGTGLGLSTVFGIVKQSGGNILVYSEPNFGATFKIYLPQASGAAAAVSSQKPALATRGSETILLVEDEDQVRSVADGILRRSGYHVLEARSPAEALFICEQHPARIDLLLSDVVMPGLSGRMLAERISAMRPGIRVLFMSGYTDDAMLHHGVLDSGFAFLQKPFTPGSLSRRVREVLDGRASGATH
jgi:signal transduction histidine kinase